MKNLSSKHEEQKDNQCSLKKTKVLEPKSKKAWILSLAATHCICNLVHATIKPLNYATKIKL
jgi:hypothetical protein